ncbi:PREDICTED: hedgehog-interacting protein [Gavialis gangeticus]|uniref:hedgehog-interacting protein n=1 Tax=Gavialis gangeticus TaxID=94835 RepID=UPI00092F0DAB|nr:PREDICTED: hedgehog-interacting protein [Gavialis gangeticus]
MCWIEHYGILYSSDPEIKHEELKGLSKFEVMTDLDNDPILEDLQKAIKSIPGNQASGKFCLSTEIYKCADDELLQKLHEVIPLCWKQEAVLQYVKDALFVQLYKKTKGIEVTVTTIEVKESILKVNAVFFSGCSTIGNINKQLATKFCGQLTCIYVFISHHCGIQYEILDDSGAELLPCRGHYPRLSCCARAGRHGLLLLPAATKIFSVTNNTECMKLLEEIKCAHCSPYAQNLFHSPEKGETSERELVLPYLCKDYCKEFFYTCRGHIPGFLQTTADEFCFYYARKDGGLCFPDFPRKQVRGPASNYLDQMEEYDKVEEISRKHKHNCFCIQEVVSGLRQPVGAVHCGDGSHRLFILEKEGYVKIFTPEGEIMKELFLDIHKLVQSGIKGGDERGLLSLAFHPNYKKNGKLYVSYTTNQERWAIGPHDHILRVVEYTVSRKNPHQVDMRTARMFLEVAELHRKHLGGQLLFGPDGFLYIFLGDGMITLDDMEEMDGLSDFTGSVLRLDVNTDLCNVPYSIPQSNPHFNSTNQPPEIFAHGLHNPGRCAVDRHPIDANINLTILCSDSNGKNRSSARILQIIKGKDYGKFYPV